MEQVDKTGQAGTEMKITDEMVEAGVQALSSANAYDAFHAFDPPSVVVRSILLAAWYCGDSDASPSNAESSR